MLKSATTLEALTAGLTQTPLGSHFATPKPPPPAPVDPMLSMTPTKPGGPSGMLIVVGLLTLIGAVAAGWWFTQKPLEIAGATSPETTVSSTPTTRETASDTMRETTPEITPAPSKPKAEGPLAGDLVKSLVKDLLAPGNSPPMNPVEPPIPLSGDLKTTLTQLPKLPLDQQAKVLANLYAKSPAKERPRELDQARDQYVDRWIKRFNQLTAEATDDIGQRNEIKQTMQQLESQLELLKQNPSTAASLREKEQQCLELAKLRSAE